MQLETKPQQQPQLTTTHTRTHTHLLLNVMHVVILLVCNMNKRVRMLYYTQDEHTTHTFTRHREPFEC